MVEAPYEIEHNDSQATANPQWPGFSTWKGSISPVGDHDYSSRATTTMTLGLVRAAQGRDEEAEALLIEGLTLVEETGFRGLEIFLMTRLEAFLRERGRDEEAERYRVRLLELAPAAGLALAFANRMDRIA